MKRWLSWQPNFRATNGNIILSILSNFVLKKSTLEIPKTISQKSIIWDSPCIDKQQFNDVKSKLNKGMQYPEAFLDIRPLFKYDSNILLSLVNFFQDDDHKDKLENKNYFLIPLSYTIYWLSCPNLSCVEQTENGINIDLTREYELLIQVILLSYNIMNLDYYYFCLDSISIHFFRYGNSKKFPFWIIPTLFERSDPQLLDIAASILSYLTKEKQIESMHKLIDCLSLNVFKNPSNYNDWNFELIVNTLLPLLAQFDISTLSLFSALATIRVDSHLEEAFFDIPRIYNSKLNSYDHNQLIKIDNIVEADTQDNFSSQQQFLDNNDGHQRLPSDLNPPPISEFQPQKDFEDFLGDKEFSQLQILLSLFDNVLPQYIDSFIDGFIAILSQANKIEYSLQFFITFIYVLENAIRYEFKSSIFEIITGKLIFNPNISIFNKNENLKKIPKNENQNEVQKDIQTENEISDGQNEDKKEDQNSIQKVNQEENYEFDFELITFLRQSVLLIIAKYSPNSIGTLLRNIENNPFLFADVIGRIHLNLEKFDLNYLTNEMSLGAVIHVINNLSDLSYYCDDETLQKISQARSTILIYLLSIFENSSVAVRCFSSTVFTHGFLGEIFDPSFQKPISMVLKQFLTKSKGDVSKVLTPTLDFICRIIDVCASMDDEDNHASVAYDLLVTVNDSILHNRLLPLKFESLITASTHYLAVRPSVKFLDQTLQLYSKMLLTSKDYSVSNVQVQQLSVAIRRSDGIRPSDSTVCCLFGMMARSRSDNVNSSFFIKEPKISILLFSIIQTEEDTLKYIKLFLELCQYSSYNCIQCHEGELDLLLVTMMKNYPSSFTFRGCQYDLVLSKENVIKYVYPLMFLIAYYDSSPQFCAGIFSLMAPSISKEKAISNDNNNDNNNNNASVDENRFDDYEVVFPEFSSNIIGQLSATVTKIAQDPKVTLNLGLPDRVISVEGLKSQDLENGFTFQFFLFVDVHSAKISKMRPLILKISDGDKSDIQFYVQGSSIVCWINSYEDSTKSLLKDTLKPNKSSRNSLFGVLFTNLPSCTWVRVSLIVQHFEEISTISFALNNSIQSTFNLNFPNFSDRVLNVQIGGIVDPSSIDGEGEEGDSQIETLALIGAFRFFNEAISKSDLTDLSELGSRNFNSNDSLNSLFSYPQLDSNNKQSHQGRTFKIEKIGNDYPIYENIMDNLKNLHVLSLTIPFFLYCEKMPPHFLEMLLDILYHVIEKEEQFPFFPLIGQILTNKSKLQLNYSLYLKFFAFAESDDQSLVKSLIYHILMNVELWSICESSQFIRIITHWNQTLYPSCHNLVDSCFSFSDLLANARIYLWYKPIEVELIQGQQGSLRPRDENLDIETCRLNYNKFLLSFISSSQDKFTSKDAQTIISHCASCQDHQQVFSLLKLFMNIINFNNLKLKIPETSSRLIYLQFKPKHEERFVIAYKLLYSLSAPNELHKFTEVIISLMNQLYFNEKLFKVCTKLITKGDCPCSYSLCICIAMNLGRKQCEKMAKILADMKITTELAEIFKYNENWCAWPLVLLSELAKPKSSSQELVNSTGSIDSNAESESSLINISNNTTSSILSASDNANNNNSSSILSASDNSNNNNLNSILSASDNNNNNNSSSILSASDINNINSSSILSTSDANASKADNDNDDIDSINNKTDSNVNESDFNSIDSNGLNSGDFNSIESSSIINNTNSNSVDDDDPCLKVINFILNVLYANFSLDALDVVMNTFDLFSFIFGDEFEAYSRIFFEKIAQHFKSTENKELRLGILLRCIKLLTLRVNDPPKMGLREYYVNSPFYDPLGEINSTFHSDKPKSFKSLENIINDLTESLEDTVFYSSLNHDNIPNFYKFGLVLDSNNQPLFDDLYKVTLIYLENMNVSNLAITFWTQTYGSMLIKRVKDEEKENLAKAFTLYASKVTLNNNKLNMTIYKSLMKGIKENRSESKFAIDSPDPSEISLALNDIFNCSLKYQSTRDIKKLFRLSMQEDSFWNDARYRLSGYSRSFVSDSSYSQPFLKRVFTHSSAFFRSQFISKSSTLIFASAGGKNNSDFRSKLSSFDKVGKNLPKGTFWCKQIKFTKEIDAVFKFSSKGDHLKIIKSYSTQRIDFSNIKRIFIRWRFLRPNALEFYLKDGDSVLVDFTPVDATKVLSNFSTINLQLVQTVSPQEFFDATEYKKQWSEGLLSNFDYLMILNTFAGRTFNDPSMYPIFPWVLSNFSDTKKVHYRNLSRPIAVQYKEQSIIYFLAPSTPMLVSYFLDRVEPFTSIPSKLKIKKLQLSDRPFKSMQETYNLATSEKVKNCWELTPEFYSAPHFFGKRLESKNKESNIFIGQSKDESQFELPPWCSTEEEFIYLHRKELESPTVSKSLNRWIDLIFGYISRGNRAQRAENVFNDVIFTEPSSSKEDQDLLEADLRKIGHMPALLFKKPHPQKVVYPRIQKFTPPQPIRLNIPRMKLNDESGEKDDNVTPSFGIISASIIETDNMTISSLCYCSDGTVYKVRTDFIVSMNCMTIKVGSIKTESGIDLSLKTVSDTIISPVSIAQTTPPQPQQQQQSQQQQQAQQETQNQNQNQTNSNQQEDQQISLSISNSNKNSSSASVGVPSDSNSSLSFAKTSLITTAASSSMPLYGPLSPIVVPRKNSKLNESCESINQPSSQQQQQHDAAELQAADVENSLLLAKTKRSRSRSSSAISFSYSTPLPSMPTLFTLPTLVVNNSNEMIICSIMDGFVVVDNKKHFLYVTKERKIVEYKDIINRQIVCMSSSEHLIAVTGMNGEIFGWDDRNFEQRLHFCCVTSDIVTSIAISSKFGIVACGTSSGELCVFSIHTHMLQFIVKLPAEPSRIIITPGWGFIVVESNQELFLVSINGKIIRRKKVDFVIAKWNSWCCERGFDFILIADTKGQIRMSEAFYIKFDDVIFQSKTKILDMKYIVLTRGIAVISADGYARLLPKGLPQ